MKAVGQEVSVDTREGRPLRLIWGQRSFTVTRILDAWRYGGRWWLNEAPRDCYLIELGLITAELHREDKPLGRWWLARIQD